MTFKKALRIDGHRDGGTLQIWMQRGQNISKKILGTKNMPRLS